jgi:hypothetical protein
LVITGWAGLPDLLIGNIWFDPADAPFVLPYDVAWGFVYIGILGSLTAFSLLTAARAWALLGATAIAFVFNYALRSAPYQMISTEDSPGYLQPLVFGTYDSLRNLGYPNLVRLVGITLGLNNLGYFQLLIQLLSLAVVCFVIWRCYGFLTAVLTLVVGAIFFSGWIAFFAPQILIESMSTSALLLVAAGLIAASRRPTTGSFVLAGIALALATLAKSTGLALTIAAIPIIRFLPRGQRTYGLMFMIVPALSVYLLMSAYNYARIGLFAPEAEGGIALAGHVGWMMQGDLPEYPGLIEKLNIAVAPSFASNPPATLRISDLSKLNEYVDYTSQLEDWLLLGIIVPELRKYNPNFGWVEMNSVLTRIAMKSIASNPYLYAREVAAHFYGMWRQVGRAWIDLRTGAIGLRSVYELQLKLNFRTGPLLSFLGAPFTPEKVRDAARQQAQVELASDHLLDYLSYVAVKFKLADGGAFRGFLSVALGVISLVLCAAIFVPGRFAFAYRAEIMLAFMLNAYMLAHAMVVWSGVQRYLAPVIPIVFVFAVCFFYSSAQFCFRDILRKRRSSPTGDLTEFLRA